MLLAYNTNGLAHHDLLDAIELLAEIGYAGHFDHARSRRAQSVRRATRARSLSRLPPRSKNINLRCVIETGARFLLDPRTKHEPTLVTADPAGRARRIDFLVPGDRYRRPLERRLRFAVVRRRPRRGRAGRGAFAVGRGPGEPFWRTPTKRASIWPSSRSRAC